MLQDYSIQKNNNIEPGPPLPPPPPNFFFKYCYVAYQYFKAL